MSIRYPRTAVLLFSLPAHLDAVRKRLAICRGASETKGTKRNRAFWEAMQQLAVAKVRAAGLTCVHSTEIVSTTDYSAPFGEQLRIAVRAVLTKGFDQVIVIGNDCPDLRVSDLRSAANALNQGQLPVGYDQRGGVFLFGLDRRILANRPAHALANLPWQTPQLGAALTNFLSNSFGGVMTQSTIRTDWNNRSDLRSGAWLSGAFTSLAQKIWELVVTVSIPSNTLVLRSVDKATHSYGMRAPPVSC
ncbi:DUF2064 domain-containing protein [Spirosoma endbachense]|uniref:DUF2064 domain-containing protein n=1 Tax=Spirosoma endbachense TaxID=2666025 RepID=A0A6P1VM25_9BACT|nr:DUF2064 domain-containing protein [Spirosoma endbachense]QHV93644.1 DUF2064 domain-containing protein [Spirosoma endbachense]